MGLTALDWAAIASGAAAAGTLTLAGVTWRLAQRQAPCLTPLYVHLISENAS
jgi:hypothetical protein